MTSESHRAEKYCLWCCEGDRVREDAFLEVCLRPCCVFVLRVLNWLPPFAKRPEQPRLTD